MTYPFQRTLRSLDGHESATCTALSLLAVLATGGLIAWATLAQIPLLKVSSQGRVEPHNAVHRIEPPESGRVVRSLLALDAQVNEGDLLIEFDTEEQRLDLESSKTTVAALELQLSALDAQLTSKRDELTASQQVDEAALHEAAAKEQELLPRRLLAERRELLAAGSPVGSTSDLEKLQRRLEVEELAHAGETQRLGLVRLQREQAARREAARAELLGLERERLRLRGQLDELKVAIERLRYQIEKKQVRAPATGRLVDVVELAAGDYITQGQRLGTVLAAGTSKVRVRARFPKETVGIVQPGQLARVKLDSYPWTLYGTVPAQVSSVGTEPGIVATPEAVPGTVRVELDLLTPSDPRISLQHGLTGSVEIEVDHVSPATLLLRAIGEWKQSVTAEPPTNSQNAPFVAQTEAR